MSKLRVRIMTSVVALIALFGGPVPSASAATPTAESIAMVGTGTVAPGYPTTGCAYQPFFGFSATVVVAGADALDADNDVPYTAYYDANSVICETFLAGQGAGTLYVMDDDGNGWAAPVNYFRTGTELDLIGDVEINGVIHPILVGWCQFAWTSINPSVTYTIECNLVLG